MTGMRYLSGILGLRSFPAFRSILTFAHMTIAVSFVAIPVKAVAEHSIVGNAEILDADTIKIGGQRIRLEGIDAAETDQFCLDAKGERWTCGIAARDQLKDYIAGREVSCEGSGTDRYERTLAVCSVAGADINAWLVREGLALAYVHYSRVYVSQESAAKDAQRGMWGGAFIAPWDWRHRSKVTVILGALSVPITAQAQLLAPVSSVGAPSLDCIIKGNVNRNDERIYHLPGQLNYPSVNMTKPETRWFCSEEEAQAAGWRRSKR